MVKGFWVLYEWAPGCFNRLWVTSEEKYQELKTRPTTVSIKKMYVKKSLPDQSN